MWLHNVTCNHHFHNRVHQGWIWVSYLTFHTSKIWTLRIWPHFHGGEEVFKRIISLHQTWRHKIKSWMRLLSFFRIDRERTLTYNLPSMGTHFQSSASIWGYSELADQQQLPINQMKLVLTRITESYCTSCIIHWQIPETDYRLTQVSINQRVTTPGSILSQIWN